MDQKDIPPNSKYSIVSPITRYSWICASASSIALGTYVIASPFERMSFRLKSTPKLPNLPFITRANLWFLQKVNHLQTSLSLWRVYTHRAFRYSIGQGITFAFNDLIYQMFARYAVGDIGGYWLSGSLSGFVSLAVLYPYDVWRVLIGPQAQSIKARNLGNLTLAVQKPKRLRSLYVGFNNPTVILGVALYRAFYFGGYETAKATLLQDGGNNTSALKLFALAWVTTTISKFMVHPLETVRNLFYSGYVPGKATKPTISSMYYRLRAITKQVGIFKVQEMLWSRASGSIFNSIGPAMLLVAYEKLQKLEFSPIKPNS